MKKVYFLVAMGLSFATLAQAQKGVVSEDVDFLLPWDLNEEYSATTLTVSGATVTMKYFSLNAAGLPKAYAKTGKWTPVTLLNGGAVKFFDCPAYAYPDAENFNEIDAPVIDALPEEMEDYIFEWNDCKGYASASSAIENDWVIEGVGNAIYLDSYCTFGGTISGGSKEAPAELTIYCTNKSQINTQFGTSKNGVTSESGDVIGSPFIGTVYLKTLDGYSTDTIFFGSSFQPGNGSDGYTNPLMAKGAYNVNGTIFDITGANQPVLSFNYGNANIPPVVGEGTIYAQRYPQFNGSFAGEAVYDCVINGGDDYPAYNFEIYGGDLVFNKPVNYVSAEGNGTGYAYCRSAATIYNNSSEPGFSNILYGFSQRGTGNTGGTGWWDCNYSPNSGRENVLSAGYPFAAVGQMIWKGCYPMASNAVRFDFDNEGNADIITVTDAYHMYAYQNEVQVAVPDNYQPKAGKYRVINGSIETGAATQNDTIGFEVWDNNGCAYVIRSVRGGEQVVAGPAGYTQNGIDIEPGETFTAVPGDSIGATTFGYVGPNYHGTPFFSYVKSNGDTIWLNRPHYVIANWGVGSFKSGLSVDEKNTEDPNDYVSKTYAEGNLNRDSLAWEEAWKKFLAEMPVSNGWETVALNDSSIIEGTVGDSIFLTYSYYRIDGEPNGGHAWSWKNASSYESANKGYPYAGAIEYAYYYSYQNTIRMKGGVTSNYIAESGDTTSVISIAQQTFPISLTKNQDSTIVDIKDAWKYTYDEAGVKIDSVAVKDTVWSFNTVEVGKRWYSNWSGKVADANGDSVQYRFNFKNYLSDGIIAVETQTTKANGEVVVVTPAEDDSEEIVNQGAIDEINTGIKTTELETRVAMVRSIYTLDGLRVARPERGIYVVKTVYSDGTVEAKRVIIR